MRSSKSRSRNKNNRNRNPVGNVVNRVFDSNGPEGKVRGTPQQIIEKYNQLARDAALSNDRVATENFQQHAEHYLRMLGEAQREQDQRREQQEREQEQRREQQERENRERQSQRDRERTQREGNDQQQAPRSERPPRAASGQTPSDERSDKALPDVLDLTSEEETGLVDTPESRSERQPAEPKPAGRTRTPRAKSSNPPPEAAPAPEAHEAPAAPAPEAAAAPEEKPKKPRAPRKPRKKPEGDAPPASGSGDTPSDASE